jgi:type I restriction enzyme S subunit
MSGQSQPLPDGWRWATLADLAEVAGGLAKGKKRTSKALLRSVPYLRVANVQRGHIDLNEVKSIEATDQEVQELRLQPGDVLLNEGGDRDKLGRGWVWKGQLPECIHQNHVFRARVRAGAILPELLSHYANSEGQRYFTAQGKQTTNLASISLGKLRGLPVPVPPPAQQAALLLTIDTHFSRLDAATATLERVQRNLERYRASVLKAAVEGRLVPTEAELAKKAGRSYEPASILLKRILAERRRRWEEAELAKLTAKGKPPTDDRWKSRYEEPVGPDFGAEQLPVLPPGWAWATVDQLLLSLDQGWSPECERRSVDSDEEWGVIKTTAIQHMAYQEGGNKALPSDKSARPDLQVRQGDILVTRAGPRVRVGVCCLVRHTRHRLMLCDKVYRLRVNVDFVSPGYMELVLNSPRVMGALERIKSGISDSGLNLTQDKFRELAIPLPPRHEQALIEASVAKSFSVSRALERDAVQSCARIARLRQSILKRAFEGRLVRAVSQGAPC